MTDHTEATGADVPADGVTRTRVRRSRPAGDLPSGGRGRPAARRRGGNRPLLMFGIGLILAGVAILSWVAWEFWGTNWVSHHRQEQVTSQLDKGWKSGQDTVHTKFGDAIAILHVPRFGSDYGVPVLEGDSETVLAAGIGHVPNTQGPGQEGNFVLAGHRVTHGEPFAKFPSLRKGDPVYVETRTTTYVYELDNSGTDLIVPFTDTWVTLPSPVNPSGGVQPIPGSDHLITLFSCSEIFHTDNRSVVFGHLVKSIPRTSNDAPVAVPTRDAPAGGGLSVWWLVAGGALVLAALAWVARRGRSLR